MWHGRGRRGRSHSLLRWGGFIMDGMRKLAFGLKFQLLTDKVQWKIWRFQWTLVQFFGLTVYWHRLKMNLLMMDLLVICGNIIFMPEFISCWRICRWICPRLLAVDQIWAIWASMRTFDIRSSTPKLLPSIVIQIDVLRKHIFLLKELAIWAEEIRAAFL
jgi:hypothetical protein